MKVRPRLPQRVSPRHANSRRRFSFALSCLLVGAARTGSAQVSAKTRHIGFLAVAPADPEEKFIWEALSKLGWVEGTNLYVERRYADSVETLAPLAEELVRAKVEVIVAGGPNPTRSAMRATTTIPIVFRRASDPILLGLVTNLARPGGNVTGFYDNSIELVGKGLALLKEVLPRFKRVGILETLGNAAYSLIRNRFEKICGALAIEPFYVAVSAISELDGEMAALSRQGAQALVFVSDRFMVGHASEIVAAALKHRLPTVGDGGQFVAAGALAAYSFWGLEGDRRTASYVDRLLRGAKPGDLPVEQPTVIWIGVNLNTARALGISVPESVILRADFVVR